MTTHEGWHFAALTDPDGKWMVEINLRCVDGLDFGSLTVIPCDGASA